MQKKPAFLLPILFLVTNLIPTNIIPKSKAEACTDLAIVFARGSGAGQNISGDYLAFKTNIEDKLKTTKLTYSFIDLDYPAVSVGLENFGVTLGAFFSGGKGNDFGESVENGVNNLTEIIDKSCERTRFVLGGYSQGAMVVLQTLSRVNPDKIIYAATFGDPKLYLPEGEGIFPAACMNINLSNYRIYVPNCYAKSGILGGENPYQTPEYFDKLGTWCNKYDIMCSSHISITDHISYVKEHIYEDASRFIFDKITKYFGVKNNYSSPHDTIILIDSTGSMREMIDQYKREALRLAKETFKKDGRVALYEYRDLQDPFEPILHCSFDTCTLEKIEKVINKIETDGGGDIDESLLSVSLKAMREMNWRRGATKSIVILTDAGFHIPDFDGTTTKDVISLSRKIDPVNFYVVTNAETAPEYEYLTKATDGKVAIISDDSKLEIANLTDHILERYDSLPRVEETEKIELPKLKLEKHGWKGNDYQIDFLSDDQTLIIINDVITGITSDKQLTITDLVKTKTNTIRLIPITNNIRGEATEIVVGPVESGILKAKNLIKVEEELDGKGNFEILVPNTGAK
ncbi:cutinase family protein [Candidatus Saccharibacteria bacterium]|nr:cutinase family protein [Candidatus Saccharibacteria bacterium]